jgi:hypothetical protein
MMSSPERRAPAEHCGGALPWQRGHDRAHYGRMRADTDGPEWMPTKTQEPQ